MQYFATCKVYAMYAVSQSCSDLGLVGKYPGLQLLNSWWWYRKNIWWTRLNTVLSHTGSGRSWTAMLAHSCAKSTWEADYYHGSRSYIGLDDQF